MNSIKEHFARKQCFVTGHTEFKGTWLALWLPQFEVQVIASLDRM